MTNKYMRLRVLLVGLAFIALFVVIGVKAVHLQVYRSPWLAQKASSQYEQSLKSNGKRGTVYDRNLREMAITIDVTSIAVRPSRIEQPQHTAKALAKILKTDRRKILKKLKAKRPFVWIKRQANPKETAAVKALELAGIEFVPERKRFYPNKTLASQALGFTGLDGYGLEGIEFAYDRYLRGTDSNQMVYKDALGQVFDKRQSAASLNTGHNIILTIDRTIQYIAESALEESVNEFSARSGMAIVMDPQTGAILAMAHVPLFNPNAYMDFNKELWRNRAITDPFEPGSTMKIFSAAAAIESGDIKAHDIFFCENGAYKIGRNVVHDIKKHGWLSLQQIIKYSSNIGAVKISEKLGRKRLHAMYRKFGFGAKTGIDSPGETTGSLMPYKRWTTVDTGAISFGYGVAVSALQMVTAASAIANDGVLMKPYFVQAITDQNHEPLKQFQPQKVRRVISIQTARTVRAIMKTVTNEGGTGVNAALDGYTVCGKTGTARKLDESGIYSKSKYMASFIGFTPAEKPRLAIVVVIDEPQGAYYGGTVAAPVFRRVARETLHYLNIPPESGAKQFATSRRIEARG
ncbi:MAG: penicillin-binding protein 2 [Desulfobacterales bacterium]|jgi:cell division protein FtsI (penicillin-binding protein 3)